MKKALMIIIVALTSCCYYAQAQSVVTVNEITLSTLPSRAYVVNRQGTLLGTTTGIYIKGNMSFYMKANKDFYASPSPHKNFIRTQIISDDQENKKTLYQYFDGLGELMQTVKVAESPGLKDIVSFEVKDRFQRQLNSYLPFASGQEGEYHDDPLFDLAQFYKGTQNVAKDAEPYSLHQYEDSPRNRIIRTYAAGWHWHHDVAAKPSNERTRVNMATEVRDIHLGPDGRPVYLQKYCPAGTMVVDETIDENGLTVTTYKDFRGQTILQKRGDAAEWHETYYIYDIQGRLRIVLPPEASARVNDLTSPGNTPAFLDTYCFQYEYDAFGRKIGQKMPGVGWTFTIYDKWDRPVYVQDARQRTEEKWIYTKYDSFNRPIMSGIKSGDRQALEAELEKAILRYEERLNNAIGYTNRTYPTHSEADLLTIDYYDCYAFLNYPGWDREGLSFHPVFESGMLVESSIFFADDPSKIQNPVIRGYKTGSKVKVMGDASRWLNSVLYYNKEYRVAQTITENHLGGSETVTTLYNDNTGTISYSRNTHTTQSGTFSVETDYLYDHADRPIKIFHGIAGQPKVLMVQNRYNELGQKIEKNIHSTDGGRTFLQSVDYRYNIQGWVTHINNAALTKDSINTGDGNDDLFGMEIKYHEPVALQNGRVLSHSFYDGNVAAVRWNTRTKAPGRVDEEKAYVFKYDIFKRFRDGLYAARGSGDWNKTPDLYREQVLSYDKNGNIGGTTSSALLRNGLVNGALGTLDKLSYRYSGNRLMNVKDSASTSQGFRESLGLDRSVDEFSYNENGNMDGDINRSISSVLYNDLNLVSEVHIYHAADRRTDKIILKYDGAGNKLRKEIFVGDKLVWKTDHINGVQYDNDKLSFFATSEGRVVHNGSSYDYEYFLKDFQSNVRVVYGMIRETSCYKATMETNLKTIESSTYGFRNIGSVSGNNVTLPSELVATPSRSARCRGFESSTLAPSPVGPAKKLTITKGDVVYAEVYARYNNVRTTANSVSGSVIAGFVTKAFGITATEHPTLWRNMTANAPLAAAGTTYQPEVPQSYLTILYFNKDSVFVKAITHGISSRAYKAHEKLVVSLPADVDGHAYVYVANLSNESTSVDVYFDDLYIIHEMNRKIPQVIQSSDYYPFGLPFNEYNLDRLKRVNEGAETRYEPVLRNRLSFQGQESLRDFNIGWYEFKYRMYDAAMGRFSATDPLAHDYVYNSPYAFSENWLINSVELEGLEKSKSFEAIKYVQPAALDLHANVSTHATKIGFDVSLGLPKFLPFSYRFNFGFSLSFNDVLQNRPLIEARTGQETSYFGVASFQSTKYESGPTSQTTGMLTIGSPLFNMQYENDWWSEKSMNMIDVFGIHPKLGGDGGDRYRTAAWNLNVGMMNYGGKLGTGDPGPLGNRNVQHFGPAKFGVYQLHTPDGQFYDPNRYRLGVLYMGAGPLQLGWNNESFRHLIQNRFVHDTLSESPWFQPQPFTNKNFYFGINTGGISQW